MAGLTNFCTDAHIYICSAAKCWANYVNTYTQSWSRLEYMVEWIKFGTIAHIYSPPLLNIFDLQVRSELGLGFQGLKISFYLP